VRKRTFLGDGGASDQKTDEEDGAADSEASAEHDGGEFMTEARARKDYWCEELKSVDGSGRGGTQEDLPRRQLSAEIRRMNFICVVRRK